MTNLLEVLEEGSCLSFVLGALISGAVLFVAAFIVGTALQCSGAV